MKIPHSFQVAPVAAPQVRKINNKTMQANAIQEQAQQGLVAGVDAAVQTGNEIYQTHIDKQYATDMVAGSAMMEQFKFQRDAEIKKIPVDSSVDFAAEVKLIEARANANWSGWSDKNIRNKSHPRVREARQQSIDAFEIDGAATSAMLGVQYEDARNINNIEMAEGIKAGQLKADPYNAQTVAELQQFQDARLKLGAITQAEAISNKAAIQVKADDMADGQTMVAAGNLSYTGDYEAAGELIDSLKTYTKEEKLKEKNKVFGSGTYNRLNDMASATDTLAGWGVYDEKLKEDSYMSVNQADTLKQRSTKGRNVIEAGQKRNLKRIVSDSIRGDLDLTGYEIGAANDSSEGLSMVASPKVEKALIKNASLFTSLVQVKEDRKVFRLAARTADKGGIKSVNKQFDTLLEYQLNGQMTEDAMLSNLSDIKKQGKDQAWSPAVIRQMERETMKAFYSSLEDDTAIRGIDYRGFDSEIPMPSQNVAAYKAVNDALRNQNAELGSFVDATGTLAYVRIQLNEWNEQNAKPTPAEIQEKAKELKTYIKKKTRTTQRLRNQ